MDFYVDHLYNNFPPFFIIEFHCFIGGSPIKYFFYIEDKKYSILVIELRSPVNNVNINN